MTVSVSALKDSLDNVDAMSDDSLQFGNDIWLPAGTSVRAFDDTGATASAPVSPLVALHALGKIAPHAVKLDPQTSADTKSDSFDYSANASQSHPFEYVQPAIQPGSEPEGT